MKNWIWKIKNWFIPEKYNIIIEQGFFNVVVHGLKYCPAGREVIIERSSSLQTDKIQAGIKVMDINKKEIPVWVISNNTQWRFCMPASDVHIIPIIKRKRKL